MDKRQVTVTFPKEELYILEDLQQLKEDYDISVSKFLRRAIKTAVNEHRSKMDGHWPK